MKQTISWMIAAISFCMMIIPINLQAQDNSILDFGIKGGLNYSMLNVDDSEKESARVGYHAGILLRLNVSQRFAIQPELLYSTKGSKITYDNLFFDGKAKFALNYIDVPLLAVVKLGKNFNIHGGPYASILMSAKAENDGDVDFFDFEKEVDRDNFKETDWGLTGGIGAETNNFMLGIRYSRGVEKIDEPRELDGVTYRFKDAQNSLWQIYAGIIF